jgi:tripartite-type tricarboxylate transporter receptor subunit TctC
MSLLARIASQGLIGTAMLAAASAAMAQSAYPSKPLHMLVPFAPGGVSDIVARLVSPKLGEALGQSVLVENRVGAGGVIATELAARSAPDGYTLLTAFDNFAANPYLYKEAKYDPVKDFAPLALVVRSRLALLVHPKLGVKTLDEFVRLAKSRGTGMSYATAGGGTSSHLVAEMFKLTAGIQPIPVHYKGGAPALNDLLGGQVDLMIATMSIALQQARAGKLVAVAVTSSTRTPLLPGVPAINETYPGFEAQSWVGFVAPAGTPRDIVQRLNGEMNKVVTSPDVRAKLEALGFEIAEGSPEVFGDWIRAESARWGKVIREAKITVE